MKPEVWALIVEAYVLGGYRTTGDLEVALLGAAKHGDILKADIPPAYSLRRHVERLDRFYSSEPVGLQDIPIEHSAYVLEVLATMLEETEGRVDHFTRAEVDWIIRVHAAAPLLPPYEVYRYSIEYWSRAQAGDSARTLDVILASYGKWGWQGFAEAMDKGWLPDGRYPGFSSGRTTSKWLRAVREQHSEADDDTQG